jgi:hypothetical protein
MEPDREASGTRRDNCLVVAGQNKSEMPQASSPNQGRAEHYRTQHSGYHSRQPRDPAAVTSKPHNPPWPDVAEPAWGKAVVHVAPAPEAGHDTQGPQPAHSHVSLRVGEHVDPPKDDARHWLNQLADSKVDEEESSAGPI